MTAQTQEKLLAAHLEQQKINADEPAVEDDEDDDDEDDEEDDDVEGQQDGDASGRSKQSRSEKKSRKAMLKLGMKAIPGVSRVTFKKARMLAEQFKAPDLSNVIQKPEPSTIAQDDEEVDETGVEPKDIELVMTKLGCPGRRPSKLSKLLMEI
ncbi:UNVERIFIED_CONTAM: Nascent polypeptide-associated complex subunit alpha-like protein 1 [Sesamum angustifolium]|uniref:Nascent polypeptide-associated complex subunit alpha-like protein 1 n=1 Tax=Sesamum angustifolium TaxID=2727405 RepID=A0AAW2J7W4_9LAMI